MAARSFLFKTISLLVIMVMLLANFNVVQAQDGAPPTPTETPQARITNTPAPTAPAETVVPPAATPTGTPPAPATALPASFSISGKVTDTAGQGLSGVEVSDGQSRPVQTDENGRYSIDGLTAGNYQVRATLPGMELIPYFRVVPVLDKNVTGVNFYPRQQPQPDYINRQPLPANHEPNVENLPYPGEGQIESQAVTQMGRPGVIYTADDSWQIGSTGVPYKVEALSAIAHLNSPTALALDTLAHLWEAEEHGNRLVAFNPSTLTPNLKIGDQPGISLMDHYTFNSLMAVGFQPQTNFLWAGDSTRLVKYDISVAYPNQYQLQFPATNPWVSGSDDGHFSEIRGIAFDTTGETMYVSDRFNHRIQGFNVAGSNLTLTGTLGVSGVPGDDGFHFNQPWHLTYSGGYLFVADAQNHRIQECPTPIGGSPCITVAGTGQAGFELNQLNTPTAVALANGKMYIADAYNQRIIRCDFDYLTDTSVSKCQVLAGVPGEAGSDSDHLRWPADLVAQGTTIYVADRDNHRVLKFDDTGSLPISPTVQLGTTGEAYPIDAALASQPHVYQPWGIAVDRADNDALYVAENWGYSLAKFYEFGPNAGKLAWRVPADPGNYGADLHHFGSFSGSNQGSLAVDDNHHIYVPDSGNNRVMVYLPDGTLFGQIGNGKGSGPYQFSCPNGVGVTLYNIFVADTCNQRIQVFDYNLNYVGTIGQTGMAGTDSGHFNHPVSVAGDLTLGYVFVVDQGNQRVQRCKWDPTKHTSTCTPFAGVTGVSGGRDFHYLNQPASVGVDTATSRVFISEEDTSRIQVFNESDGAYLTTLSGEWGYEGSRVRDPAGISIGMNSEVYVADRENARILRFSPVIAGWNQLNINGFGSPFNKDVSGLAYVKVLYKGIFTIMLYAITSNYHDNQSMSQVWRRLPDDTWQAVSAPGFDDSSNYGLSDMAVYIGADHIESLYAGTYSGNGGQLWRCDDLSTNPCEKPSDWTRVPAPVGFSAHNQIASRMVVFNGLLFVSYLNWSGSTSDGGEVWAYDGSDWTSTRPLLKLDGTTTGTGHPIEGIHAMAVSADSSQLYAGTVDNVSSTPAQLYRYAYDSGFAGWQWKRVLENGITDTDNAGILSMLDYNGYLYLGTFNFHDGAMIYRYSDTDLSGGTAVVSGGLSSERNNSICAMNAYEDRIYALTGNGSVGVQVLSAPISGGVDGTWNLLSEFSGFGNSTNNSISSDSSVTFSPDGHLLVGTWNDDNGGALWLNTPDSAYSYHVRGHISFSGGTLPPVTVTLKNYTSQLYSVTTTTDGGGNYEFDHLLPGAYYVEAYQPFFSFSPPIQPVAITTADVDKVNFTAASGGIALSLPPDGTQLTSLDPVTLAWQSLSGATSYTLQVSNNTSFSPVLKNVTQAATTFKLAGLLANKTYYWKVRKANSPAGVWSVTFSFKTPVLGPPAAPVLQAPLNKAALPAGVLQPSLTWKPSVVPPGSAEVKFYHIQLARQNSFTPPDVDEYTPDASTTFVPTVNLTPNQVYYWRVRAFNTAGDASVWSGPFSFKILPVPPLTAWAYDTNTLQPGFHWSDPYCTGKYLVEVYKSTTKLTRVVSTPVTTGALCEGDFKLTTSLLLNTKYEWHITTQGVTGNSKPYTDKFTTPSTVPGTPTLTGPVNNEIIPDSSYSNWQPRLAWNPVSASTPVVEVYPIQVATQPGFGAYTFIDTSVSASTTSFLLPDALQFNATVYWRVRACDSHKNCSVWSAAHKLVTRPARPDTPENIYDSLQVLLRWHDPGGNSADSYNLILYDNAPICTTVFKSVSVAANSYAVAVLPHVTYCWKVRGAASPGSVTGDYSALATFGEINVLPAPALDLPANNALIEPSGVISPDLCDYPVNFIWSGMAGRRYNIQVSRTADFTDLVIDDSTLTLPNTTRPVCAGKYSWRVRAGSGGLWGAWSAVRSFSTKAQVFGSVYDDTRSIMPGFAVSISGVTAPILTDSNGNYACDSVPAGSHVVTFAKTGYLTQTRTLTFANGTVVQANAVMVHAPATGILRIQLSWNPAGPRKLAGHLWLPLAGAMHIFSANYGKPDLNVFPNAMAHTDFGTYGQNYFDIQPQAGNYVFAVNQEIPTTTAWSGSDAKVDVYNGASLLKSCPLPSGSGSWWYAFDLHMTGATSAVTCKNSLRATIPNPYSEYPIVGQVSVQSTGHPLSGVVMRYDTGQVTTDAYGYFSIPGLVSGSTTLTPQTTFTNYTFDPVNTTAPVDSSGVTFNAIPAPSSLAVKAPMAISVQGDYAYLGVGAWFYVVDMHDKAAPVFASRLWLGGTAAGGELITQIVNRGSQALVVTNHRLDVINVSAPLHAQYLAMAPVPEGTDLARVAISGDTLYLAAGNYFYIDSFGASGLAQAGPSLIYSRNMGGASGAKDVAVQGKYAYVAGQAGLTIFDVTNPASPDGPWLFSTPSIVNEVEVDGAYAYLSTSEKLYVVNISDPAHVTQVTALDFSASVTRMVKSGNYLYLSLYRLSASIPDSMTIIDVSKPIHPVVRGSYHDPLDPLSGLDISVQEGYAFLVHSLNSMASGKVSLINIANKNAPAELSSYMPGP